MRLIQATVTALASKTRRERLMAGLLIAKL